MIYLKTTDYKFDSKLSEEKVKGGYIVLRDLKWNKYVAVLKDKEIMKVDEIENTKSLIVEIAKSRQITFNKFSNLQSDLKFLEEFKKAKTLEKKKYFVKTLYEEEFLVVKNLSLKYLNKKDYDDYSEALDKLFNLPNYNPMLNIKDNIEVKNFTENDFDSVEVFSKFYIILQKLTPHKTTVEKEIESLKNKHQDFIKKYKKLKKKLSNLQKAYE